MSKYAIILAAGKGTRMKSAHSDISKVSFPILGRPLVKYVLDALEPLGLDETVTIVGFGGETTEKIVKDYSKIAWQKEQKGTGHAVMQAAPILGNKKGQTIICCGDTPLLTTATLEALFKSHEENHNSLTLLTAVLADPHGYGRIVKENGRVLKIVEQKDCNPEENLIKEVNAGVYVFDNEALFSYLDKLTPNNAAGEYYLTDLLGMFVQDGLRVSSFSVEDMTETLGINDRFQLCVATSILRMRINKNLMLSGVSIEDPESTYIAPGVEIGNDTIIKPNTHIMGNSKIGHDNIIGPNAYLENVEIGDRNIIDFCHVVDTVIDNDTNLGPYLRTRKGTHIHDGASIGNFNELKNTEFGKKSKAHHLSYLGDAKIGEETNIGCGTIIANFDGVNKNHTEIGDHAFVGSGSTIIAPLTIEDYGFTAAGSVITEDVKSHDLAIARARQENKKGYADVILNKNKK